MRCSWTLLTSVASSALVMASVGCAIDARHPQQRGEPVDDVTAPPDVHTTSLFRSGAALRALNGRMDGAIGNVVGVHGDSPFVQFSDDPMWTDASFVVNGAGGSAMAILSLAGSVRDLPAGETSRTCSEDWSDPNSAVSQGDSVGASVTGCSGPEEGTWEFDAPADCVDVRVDEPDMDAPADAVASVFLLAHFSDVYTGTEHAVKARIDLTED